MMMAPNRRRFCLLHLHLLLLGFNCLLPLGAVPASRSLASRTLELERQRLNQVPPVLSIRDQESIKKQLVVDMAFIRGRMDIQSFNDYPGSGANNRHDPKTPGRG